MLRHIHGLSPFPGAWCELATDAEPARIKILRCEPAKGSGEPGEVLDDGLTIACGDGAIRILELQRAGKAPGRTPKLNPAQCEALAHMIESGPIPAIHGVVRWRLIDLAQWLWEEYRIRVAKQTLSRQLRAMGFRKLSARPRPRTHNEHAAEAFKKTSPTFWRRSSAVRPPAPK